MITDCEERLLKKFDPNQNFLWMWNPSKGKSGGILVGVNIELYDVGSFRRREYMLQLNLWDKVNKLKWNLLIVYGAAQEENKVAFLFELSNFCSSNFEPLLIGGDFNIIRYANEKNTKDGVHRHTDLFNSLIHFYELREIDMTGGMYTWPNNQGFPVLEKLDRILVTKEWEDIFPKAMVKKLPREISDHNPLIISSGICDKAPFIHFKFDLNWLKNPVYYQKVEEIWNKPCRTKLILDKIQQKLKLFKQYFKGWGFNVQGEMRKKGKKTS
jgi:hypothetical protein